MSTRDLEKRLRDEYETRLAESGNDLNRSPASYMVGAFGEGVALALAALRAEEAAGTSDEFHDCMACPLEVRNLGAVLHNLVGAVERGEWTRVPRKVHAAKLALETWQPIADAHFAARDEMTKWPRNAPKDDPT